jgi:hypothetical protein
LLRFNLASVFVFCCVVLVSSCGGSSGDGETATGAIQWRSVLSVQEGDSLSGPPLAIVDAGGNATLLWNRYAGTAGVYSPFAARSTDNETWTVASDLESVPATLQSVALALTDAAGTPLAIWSRQNAGSPSTLRGSSFRGTWSAPEALPENGYTTGAELAGSTRGEFFAIWVETRDNDPLVVAAARREASGQWSRTTPLATPPRTSLDVAPVIAADDSGNAMALWVQGTPARIYASRLAAGQTTWATPVSIDAGTAESSWPRIVFVGNGVFAAAWDQTAGGRRSVHATRYDGRSWHAPGPLDDGAGGDASGARLAGNGLGRAMAVWARSEGISQGLWAATFDASGWRLGQRLVTPSPAAFRSVASPAIDRFGNQAVAWTASGGNSGPLVEYAFLGIGSLEWTAPVPLSDRDAEPAPPALAMNGDGQAVIAWVRVEGTRRTLQARMGQRP